MALFMFSYQMHNRPEQIKSTVLGHVSYWKSQTFEYYKGGPYADRSGGMIIFTAPGIAEARSIIEKDPFMKNGIVDTHVLKEWKPE